MNLTFLKKIIQEGEGLFQEFKTSLEKVDRSMVAFANARGGTIYLGVDDQGKSHHFELSNRLKAQLQDIAKNIDPPLNIKCSEIGNIVVIQVKEGEDKPYKCSDGFFLRVGAANQKLRRDDILDLVVQFNRVRFETLYNELFRFPDDFSRERYDFFVKASHLEQVSETLGQKKFLISLGVCELQRGKILFNNAGILFFAHDPRKFLPQARLNYVRYQGVTKSHVIDRRIFDGSILEQLDGVFRKLAFDTPVAYELTSSSVRQEKSHYPMRALEEAIINALIHRDYYEVGAETMVEIFSDRIEVTNPGRLLGSLQLDKLENRSLRRNPVVAELLYRTGRGEKLGSGIARMKMLMREWKLKPPHFVVEDAFFSVTFRGPKEFFPEEKLITLAPRLKQFAHLRNQLDDMFTAEQYAALLSVTTRTAQKDLGDLMEHGIVERMGKGKSTIYKFR
ncbi:MAG: putative DNA binding domain-containing protein [Deltaproteobacteria bacterium]|nr:putative DNA binding domain-containing protein [Deltaproteobacteria bacterium]